MKEVKKVIPYRPRIIEQFKAEVESKPARFPKELGEEHPFDFKLCEQTYCVAGIVKAIVDKYIDYIVSPGFFIKCDNKKAETLINKFIRETSFEEVLRDFIQEGLIKGNGFIEIAIDRKEILMKVVNANNMYVKRNRKGELKGYNQYVGKLGRIEPNKIVPFDIDEIAHLKITTVGDDAYGRGIVFPMLVKVDYLAQSDKDSHVLMGRKANSPIVAYIGTPESPPTQSEIDDTGSNFEYLNNYHEWSFPFTTKLEVLNFGNLGDKFTGLKESDLQELFYIAQIPSMLMGIANISEGQGEVQMDGFERRIKSLQARVEKIVEERIFMPLLKANGLAIHVEFEWGQPSEIKVNQRLEKLSLLIQNPMLNPILRTSIERDIAEMLNYEEALDAMEKPKDLEGADTERREEEELEQPEIPGEKEMFKIDEFIKKKGNQYCVYSHQTGKNFGCYPTKDEAEKRLAQIKSHKESLEDLEDHKLNEWLNFDYKTYQEEVLKFIQRDNFNTLAGSNKEDYNLGLLNRKQIAELKDIMYEGFQNNKSIREIAEEIKKINLKDRYTIMDGKKILSLSKEERPISIARSESTRVAAEGVLNHFENQERKEVTWVASISDRTCPYCESQNGRIYKLNEAHGLIPAHSMCRCSWVSFG